MNYRLFGYVYECVLFKHLSNCSGVSSDSKNAKIYICFFKTIPNTHTTYTYPKIALLDTFNNATKNKP